MGENRDRSRRAWIRHGGVAFMLCALAISASCERTPSKSDYVSARVRETCGELDAKAAQSCRIEVIKQFTDVPLEEMQRRYPPPEPRDRPSCGF
jgi:hypothetical protein